MKNKIKSSKFFQRKKALVKRKKIFNKNIQAHEKLFNNLYTSDIFDKSNIVASYFSVNSEIQTENLNNRIIISKKKLCLPAIESKNNFLLFRIFNKETKMIKGKFQIMEPEKKSNKVCPDLLLVPCVAFDKLGYRIGYGGGYYDRIIEFLKKKKKIITIGLAFDFQKFNSLPISKFDQKLDYIVTNKNILQ